MNKYNGKSNISGEIIQKHRLDKNLSLEDLSNMLQLKAITLYPNDIFLLEKGKRIVKDFELLAICDTLNINLDDVNNLMELSNLSDKNIEI